jgi:hypothetical protein
MREIMRAASRDLLGGFELRVDFKPSEDLTIYPNHFIDKRERDDGMRHWNRLMQLIEEAENDESGRSGDRGRDAGSPDEGLLQPAEADNDAILEETAATEIGI